MHGLCDNLGHRSALEVHRTQDRGARTSVLRVTGRVCWLGFNIPRGWGLDWVGCWVSNLGAWWVASIARIWFHLFIRNTFITALIFLLLAIILYQSIFDRRSINYKSYDDCILLELNGSEQPLGVVMVREACENKFRKPPLPIISE